MAIAAIRIPLLHNKMNRTIADGGALGLSALAGSSVPWRREPLATTKIERGQRNDMKLVSISASNAIIHG